MLLINRKSTSSASAAAPIQNDPWAPCPTNGLSSAKAEPEMNHLLGVLTAEPSANSDPWAAFDNTHSTGVERGMIALTDEDSNIIRGGVTSSTAAAVLQQRSSTKTPESFLGGFTQTFLE